MRFRIASIENLISQDPGHRNIFPLVQRDHLRLAALSLLRAKRVLIVSGFPVPQAGAGETDGPPGAWALGMALRRLGIPAAYLTDEMNAPLFKALGAEPVLKGSSGLLQKEGVSHLVAVERPGRARDGRYYTMRGDDITAHVEPLDALFLEAETRGIVTIGIGDGGNEIGMGRVFQGVSRSVPQGQQIASTVLTDYVIVSGVSNWGAYGLVGALCVVAGQDLLPTAEEMVRSVQAVVQAGGVDGRSGRREFTVDGLPLSRSVELMEEIRWHLLPSPLERASTLSVGILGAGESGRAAARLLMEHGARVRLSDHAWLGIPPDLAGCEWERGGHTLQFLEGTDLVVRSPGISPHLPILAELRERGVPVLSELEVAYQLGHPALIAVTGSAGKRSTVKAIGRLMAACGHPIPVGGNKGRPLSQLVGHGSGGWMAIAVSSFQLEAIVHFRPRVAVILNISHLHADRHGDVAETVRIKSRIFMNQGAGDILVLNRDDPSVAPLAERHWGEILFVSSQSALGRGVWIEEGRIWLATDGEAQALGNAPTQYPENLLCAILVAALLGASSQALGEALVREERCLRSE
jgi:hypothetical protein